MKKIYKIIIWIISIPFILCLLLFIWMVFTALWVGSVNVILDYKVVAFALIPLIFTLGIFYNSNKLKKYKNINLINRFIMIAFIFSILLACFIFIIASLDKSPQSLYIGRLLYYPFLFVSMTWLASLILIGILILIAKYKKDKK